MSRKPIAMRKIKEILRLKFDNQLKDGQIAEICHIGRSTVQDYLTRFRVAFSTPHEWRDCSDDELERRLFPGPQQPRTDDRCPDWQEIHRERRRPGVTLDSLWADYRARVPNGYSYPHFCDLYCEYRRTIDVRMRQTHKLGEKMFVDYSGRKASVVDPQTGEIVQVEVFVAVLGASNYTYVEATWTQSLPDWIGSHVRALEFFGGVPELIVPDNLKSAISKAWYYDPEVNPTYAAFAGFYGTAVLPTRARRPRDKAKVENAVLVVQRWILAQLRNRRFFSLADLNTAIHELLEQYNRRPFKKLAGSRWSLFEEMERASLRPLPAQPYEYAEWKKATVNVDYHLEYDRHYYSVPYQHVRQRVDVRATATTIEVFLRSNRLCGHARSRLRGKHTTIREHMPPSHQLSEWNPERLHDWAKKWGSDVERIIDAIIASKPHPQQGYRACLGVLRLGQSVGPDRLNAACRRALLLNSPRFSTIHNILTYGQENQPLPGSDATASMPTHDNIRGATYYQRDLPEVSHAEPENR